MRVAAANRTRGHGVRLDQGKGPYIRRSAVNRRSRRNGKPLAIWRIDIGNAWRIGAASGLIITGAGEELASFGASKARTKAPGLWSCRRKIDGTAAIFWRSERFESREELRTLREIRLALLVRPCRLRGKRQRLRDICHLQSRHSPAGAQMSNAHPA
jgi:hypothetical protein